MSVASQPPAELSNTPFAQYDHLMSQGVSSHILGNFHEANEQRERACALVLHWYDLAPTETDVRRITDTVAPDDIDRLAHAKRDLAASRERVHLDLPAQDAAIMAYELHKRLVEQSRISETDPARYRELGASALYVGALTLKQDVRRELRKPVPDTTPLDRYLGGQRAVTYMRTAQRMFAIARDRGATRTTPDQYEINAARRISIAESLEGDVAEGHSLARLAIHWAFLSEKNTPEHKRAVAKALLGGMGALRTNQHIVNNNRRAALAVASRIL